MRTPVVNVAASPSALLDRGIWQAPWFGPNGEMVLLAITRAHGKLSEVIVPHGASRTETADRMLAELNAVDPRIARLI